MTVYVSEYGGFAPGPLQVGFEPPIVSEYTVTATTAGATSTQAFDNATNYIRLHTDAVCSIAIVATTTGAATTTNKRLAADQTEYFAVKPGYHVSVVINS